ncbi:MAG: cohesin domain-containing protein [Patescibacteria group bacterium]
MRYWGLRIWIAILLVAGSVMQLPISQVAAETAVDAPAVNLFFSPASQSVIEGSTFQVSLYIDTKGQSMSTMELLVKFNPQLMEVVTPAAGQSLIQLWLQPPSYSNSEGTARFVGLIPNGIVTESGLVTTITFRALAVGKADVSLLTSSQVLANDGLGTAAKTSFGRASYTITPKPPSGVRVFSATHPFETDWYKEKNVVIGWDQDPEVDGFSFSLDTEPSTVPDDVAEGLMTSKGYENLSDGLHYFHIRASKQGVWGQTSHFLVRIDSIPPAAFKPKVEEVVDDSKQRRLVSFFTTDSLSRMDHYEIGVIDKTESPDLSPVFVQAVSPYQFTTDPSHNYRVVVRAVDAAGNTRDQSLEIRASVYSGVFAGVMQLVKGRLMFLLSLVLAILVGLIALHYIVGHHVYSRFRALLRLLTHDDEFKQIENQLAARRHVKPKMIRRK